MGALHFAAQKGHLEVVRALVSSGASLKSSTRKGLTALHYAIQGSHHDLIRYLVKKGANLDARTKAGETPRDLAKSEEIRAFLTECERAGSHSVEQKPTEEKSDGQVVGAMDGGDLKDGGNVKRRGEGEGVAEVWPEPKKARVALNHLLRTDDTLEDEGNHFE